MSRTPLSWADTLTDKFLSHATKFPLDEVDIQNGDEVVTLTMGYALASGCLAGCLIRRGIPLPPEAIFTTGVFSNDILSLSQTAAMELFFAAGYTGDQLNQIYEEQVADANHLSNLIATELGDYVPPLHLFAISKTLRNPRLREVLDSFNPKDYAKFGIKRLEQEYEAYSKRVVAIFSEVEENNCFRPYLLSGALNAGQFFRLVGSIGLVTDVDDTVIPIPIPCNYLNGYNSICYYAIDSLSAKKSDHYNKNNMKDAQYKARQTQLSVSSVGLIKPGDCGTDLTVPMMIEHKYATRFVGKHVVTDNGVVEITRKNYKEFGGKRWVMKSPLVCRHATAFCHECGGRMAKILPQHTNMGIAAVLEFFTDLVQDILSAKHLAITRIVIYMLSRLLTEIFDVRANEIYFRTDTPGIDPSKLLVGVRVADAAHVGDLSYATGDDLNEQFFTRITVISIADAETGELLVPAVPMVDSSGNTPYFSKAYLDRLRNNSDLSFRNGDMIWFKMKGFNFQQPIIKIPAVSESSLAFITRIMTFFNQDIVKYKDVGHALHDLTELVWERSKANVLHLEIAVKSCLVTSPTDYTMPRVYDPKAVTFGGLRDIITNRHLGNELAFQEITSVITDPAFYLQEKPDSLFDQFVAYRDHCFPEDYGLLPVADRRYANRPK